VTRCPKRGELQDFLEGLLGSREADAFREHLRGCPDCSFERATYERLFTRLDSVPLAVLPAGAEERLLSRVLPSRQRERWLVRVGWSYAGALAACVTAVAVWATQPSARAFVPWLTSRASEGVLHSLEFVFQGFSSTALTLASGWSLVAATAVKLAPITRALGAVLSHPVVGLAAVLACASCVALLWWMRPRRGRLGKGIRYVGVLGF
jgi:hypothetical protein